MPSGSPTAVDGLAPRISPSTGGWLSQSGSGPVPSNRHRRSPTAPEAPTNNDMMPPEGAPPVGKTWAAGDNREREREDGYGEAAGRRSVPMPAPSPPMRSQMPPPSNQAALQQQQAQAPDVKSRNMMVCSQQQSLPEVELISLGIQVNKKAYARLDLIGKGGSSRVYRVMNGANEIFAIKRVALDKTDDETIGGYMNEISLLKRLEGNSRIIRLIDSELKPGPGGQKGHLLLVMECGEIGQHICVHLLEFRSHHVSIDLARLLQEQQKEPLDLVWVAYYWKQVRASSRNLLNIF